MRRLHEGQTVELEVRSVKVGCSVASIEGDRAVLKPLCASHPLDSPVIAGVARLLFVHEERPARVHGVAGAAQGWPEIRFQAVGATQVANERRDPRVGRAYEVRLAERDIPGRVQSGTTIDLSAGGTLCAVEEPPPLGTAVELDLMLFGTAPMHVPGVVVRHAGPATAIRFDGIGRHAHDALSAFVCARLPVADAPSDGLAAAGGLFARA